MGNDAAVSLVERLTVGDATGALTAFTDGAREKYAQVFANLGNAVRTVAPQLGNVVFVTITDELGELTVVQGNPGQERTFLMPMIKGTDGIWRIESM